MLRKCFGDHDGGCSALNSHLECWRRSKSLCASQAALADPYFAGLSQPAREPSAQPVSKLAFEFERRKLQVDEVRS